MNFRFANSQTRIRKKGEHTHIVHIEENDVNKEFVWFLVYRRQENKAKTKKVKKMISVLRLNKRTKS